MSLFDEVSCDDESSISSEIEEERLSTEKKVEVNKIKEEATDIQSLLGIPSRNTLTSNDLELNIKHNSERLSKKVNSSSFAGFGDKIASSLQTRQQEREALRYRRLQRQRHIESKDANLVKKDKEIGVFITPVYKDLLRRGMKSNDIYCKEEEKFEATLSGQHVAVDVDDEEPLNSFITLLESKRKNSLISEQDAFLHCKEAKAVESNEEEKQTLTDIINTSTNPQELTEHYNNENDVKRNNNNNDDNDDGEDVSRLRLESESKLSDNTKQIE